MAKEKKKTSWLSKLIKAIFGIVFSLGGIVLVLFGTLNIVRYGGFGDFNKASTKVSKNWGLNEPYAPQGLEYVDLGDGKGQYITTAYSSKEGVASKIFTSEKEGFDLINPNGSKHTGHVGGIAINKRTNTVIVASENFLHFADLNTLKANIDKPGELQFYKSLETPFSAAFVYSDNATDTILTGEFYNGKAYMGSGYKTKHGEEEHNALMGVYWIDDLLATTDAKMPEALSYIALPNKVQGVAVHNDHLYLSTSYSLATSHIYTYDLNGLPTVSLKHLDIDRDNVLFLDEAHMVGDLKAPWMTEDLTIVDNKLIVHFESASTKYIFGKLFFENSIHALDILK